MKPPIWLNTLFLMVVFLALTACENNMRDQPRYKPLAFSPQFPDGSSARPLVDGVVPNDRDVQDDWFYSGKTSDGRLVDGFPFQVTEDVVKRGQERFDIFCSPCHGFDGEGNGMIVQRGFSPPPSLLEQRFQQVPVGHFVDVITNGFGRMYSYGYRVAPSDRWSIAAYIRALQLSANATTKDVPPDELKKLEATP